MIMPWYNAKKASQVAAFFCIKEGGKANVLKLTKLIYISDRTHIEKYGYPIIDDEFVSMPHGPVNSLTLNFIQGNLESSDWSENITDKSNYAVALANPLSLDDLDELSRAEIDSLEKVWIKFGGLDQYQVRNWTHDNCPEWEDPSGSANPIPLQRIMKFVGIENSELYERRHKEMRQLATLNNS